MGENLDDYYEDVGDPLEAFRRKVGGGMYPNKKGKIPIDKDPDVIQSKRQEKLAEQQRQQFGSY